MSDRLREADASTDPVLARAAQLLNSLESTGESELSRRRVWLSLLAEPRRVTRTRLLRPALAAALLVCLSAAAAGASAGRGWLARVASALGSQAGPAAPAESRLEARPRAHAPRGPVQAAPPAATPPSELPAPAALESARSPSRPARSASVATRADTPKRSSVGAEAFAAAPREEASLVLGAMTALRRDRDPARSARMLGAYLRQYPKGVLREEALALALEAASNLRDPKLGASIARGYLQSHPNGRFRDLAKNALEHPAPPEPSP